MLEFDHVPYLIFQPEDVTKQLQEYIDKVDQLEEVLERATEYGTQLAEENSLLQDKVSSLEEDAHEYCERIKHLESRLQEEMARLQQQQKETINAEENLIEDSRSLMEQCNDLQEVYSFDCSSSKPHCCLKRVAPNLKPCHHEGKGRKVEAGEGPGRKSEND